MSSESGEIRLATWETATYPAQVQCVIYRDHQGGRAIIEFGKPPHSSFRLDLNRAGVKELATALGSAWIRLNDLADDQPLDGDHEKEEFVYASDELPVTSMEEALIRVGRNMPGVAATQEETMEHLRYSLGQYYDALRVDYRRKSQLGRRINETRDALERMTALRTLQAMADDK